MNKICGIYKITSPSGKIYIGQSRDINRRKRNYKNCRCKNQIILYNSLLKHGLDNHIFEIICECSELELNKLESINIKKFNTFNSEYGMNLTSGGDHSKHSNETKRKISKRNKGRVCSEGTKRKISIANKGKRLGMKSSKETKIKLSISHKGKGLGKKLTDEHKQKISNSHKGKKLSEEHKNNISKNHPKKFLGQTHTEESKENISNSIKQWHKSRKP